MAKSYSQGKDLREKILRGASILADNVASTLGPKGRNVILHKKGSSPMITKDGVTVAKFIKLEDPFENLGAQIIKQAASNTNTSAGDGTTTSTVLAREMLSKAQKYIAAGASPIDIKRGMDKATEAIVAKLETLAKPIKSEEDIRHVATISANGDESIGEMIAMAVDKIGKDGAISIEAGRSMKTSLDIVEGFRFDAGYYAQAFVTNKRKQSISYEDVLILVTNYRIEMLEEVLPILEVVAREGRPFIIVSEELEGQALAALIMNTVRGTMKVAAVKAPRYGQERKNILEDLCVSSGATFISRDSGIKLSEVKLKHLGNAKKIEVLKNQTTIVDGKADWTKVEERIESLKEEIKQTDNIAECERLQERITRLSSGVAVINVGAPTEIEMVEKKHRIEDALEAVRSAQIEGTVPGGGTTLMRAVQDLDVEVNNDDQRLGVEVIKQSAYGPLKQMAVNAGESYDLILNQLLNSPNTHGWNFATNEVVDMYSHGIIDPAKVTRTALQNATSVASTLITTNHAIVEGTDES